MERDRPLYCVALLHQCRLVHGPDPTTHVLLCVRTEEICAHPAVFRLRANHRVPVVNVGAHSCMGRLSKREEEIRWDKKQIDGRTRVPEEARHSCQRSWGGNKRCKVETLWSSQQHLLEGGRQDDRFVVSLYFSLMPPGNSRIVNEHNYINLMYINLMQLSKLLKKEASFDCKRKYGTHIQL